ncbi:MAG: protein kinase [Planctomycetes bacterium]|nr:protein kinase [Planctomycetota bacterium]
MIAGWRLMRCVGIAIAEKGLRELVELAPFGTYAVKIYEIGELAFHRYHEECQDENIARAIPKEMEQLAQAKSADVNRVAKQMAVQLLPNEKQEVQEALAGTLATLPTQVRKLFMRKDDRTGTTRPPAFFVSCPADLVSIIPPRPPRFKQGDLLPNDPKWTLVHKIDSGGFGEVWKVRHTTLKNRYGAVKFCLDATAQDRLLKHEARVIDQVMEFNNDHIVRLEDVDFVADPPWLRYEFINGGNLLSAADIPVDIAKRTEWATWTMLLPLARAVGACHLLKPAVVHRDLKPANILIDHVNGQNRLKITDFGISEIIAQHALDQARSFELNPSVATPTILRGSYCEMYASTQQKNGLPSSPTDDVHALGVLWFQMLMGDYFLPLGRDYRDELAGIGLAKDAIVILERCVADKADSRWPNAHVLAQQIEKLPNCLSSRPVGTNAENPTRVVLPTVNRSFHAPPKGPIGRITISEQSHRRTWDVEAVIGASVGLVMDASHAMKHLYGIGSGFGGRALPNQMKRIADRLMPFLSALSLQNGIHFLHSSTGPNGNETQTFGLVNLEQVRQMKLGRPQNGWGGHVRLTNAIRELTKAHFRGSPLAVGVLLTYGGISDVDSLATFSKELISEIELGQRPLIRLFLIDLKETSPRSGPLQPPEPLVGLGWRDATGVFGRLWECLPSSLLDEPNNGFQFRTLFPDFFSSGRVLDSGGNMVKEYPNGIPKVLRFELPVDSPSFTLQYSGRQVLQPLV